MYLAATVSMDTIRMYEVDEDEFRDAIRRFVSPNYEIKQGPNREVQVYLEPLNWRWGKDCFSIKIPSYAQGGYFVLSLNPPPLGSVVTAKSNPLTSGHLGGGIFQEAHEKMLAAQWYEAKQRHSLSPEEQFIREGRLIEKIPAPPVRKPSSKKKLLLT
jgi:hypothetical protein